MREVTVYSIAKRIECVAGDYFDLAHYDPLGTRSAALPGHREAAVPLDATVRIDRLPLHMICRNTEPNEACVEYIAMSDELRQILGLPFRRENDDLRAQVRHEQALRGSVLDQNYALTQRLFKFNLAPLWKRLILAWKGGI